MAATVDALRALLDPLGEVSPPLDVLVDWEQAAAVAHRFKVDVSFALRRDGRASRRCSINDTGEPAAFRERLERAREALGVPEPFLEKLFALSDPDEVQRTIGLKWKPQDPRPARVSLYLEELFRSERGDAIGASLARLALGRPLPPAPRAATTEAGAVCVDWVAGALVAVKDYRIVTETSDRAALPLPPALDAHRRAFPLDPDRGTRRYLLARRFDRQCRMTGAKLLWMSEAHDPSAIDRAWSHVERLRRALGVAGTEPSRALDALRSAWIHDAQPYPDLISLDVDAAGAPQALVVYVSLK